MNHSGTILINETWESVDNPHIITDTIIIDTGVTLTIQEGCIIYNQIISTPLKMQVDDPDLQVKINDPIL